MGVAGALSHFSFGKVCQYFEQSIQSIGVFRTGFYECGVDCLEVVYERSSTGRDRFGLIYVYELAQ